MSLVGLICHFHSTISVYCQRLFQIKHDYLYVKCHLLLDVNDLPIQVRINIKELITCVVNGFFKCKIDVLKN